MFRTLQQTDATRTDASHATAVPRRSASERGTVIILVVAVLALLVVLGAAYLRSATSNSRAASIRDERPAESAIDTVVGMARRAMLRDLYGDDTVLLDAATGSGGDRDNVTGETLDEAYDYPHNDVDAWLASNSPAEVDINDDGITDEFRWPHLTWLGEPFLAGAGDEADRSTNVDLAEVTPEADLESDDLADADGDGVADSRWFRLPTQPVSDREYIAAVRIVDLSAMANANIALSMIDTGGDYSSIDSAVAPKWLYPTDLDYGRFASEWNETTTRLDSFFARRLGTDASVLPINRQTRDAFWNDGWRQGFPPDTGAANALSMRSIATMENELELRSLHWPRNDERSTDIERRLPTATNANRTTQATSPNFPTYFDDDPRHRTTVFSAAAPYYLRETSNDGSVVAAPAIPLRPNINTLHSTLGDLVTEIEKVLDGNRDNVNDVFSLPAQFLVDGALPAADQRNAYARQIAANLVDYLDAENPGTDVTLTAAPGPAGATTRYGLEALPFITEVYRQRTYKAEQWEQETAGKDVNGDGIDGDTKWYLVLEQEGDTGYAIELRNPFNREISLEGITLAVGSDPDVTTITLSNHATTLAADEALLLYHNPDNADPDHNVNIYDPDDKANDRVADGGVVVDAHAAGAMPQFEGNDHVTVELRVGASDGETIAYQRAVSRKLDDSETEYFVLDGPENAQPPDEDPPVYRYKMLSNVGSADGVNMMTIESDVFRDEAAYLPDNPPVTDPGNPPGSNPPADAAEGGPGPFPASADEIDQLGVTAADKSGADGKIAADKVDQNQIVIPVGKDAMPTPADIAMLTILGPRADDPEPPAVAGKTIAEAWGDAASVEAHMLNLTAPEFVGPNGSDHALPHALLLVDRFASNRYDADGIDNDGDGESDADDPDEAMIPGRINLNTVDERTLTHLLPMPKATAGSVAKQIIAYRDRLDASGYGGPNYNDNGRGGANGLDITDWRDRPGIATLGELYPATSFLLGNDKDGADTPIDNKQWDAVGTDFRIDFTPNSSSPDGIANDREEKAMIVRWLSQVATTRSDRFAAYILVRGYDRGRPIPSGDTGWEQDYLAERRRAVVLFDRSPALAGEEKIEVRAERRW